MNKSKNSAVHHHHENFCPECGSPLKLEDFNFPNNAEFGDSGYRKWRCTCGASGQATYNLEFDGYHHYVTGGDPREDSGEHEVGICPICYSDLEYDSFDIENETLYRNWSCMDCVATGCEGYNMIFVEHQKVSSSWKRIPVYKYPAKYAEENGELDMFRVSNKANSACKEAIEQAIRTHYRYNVLDPAGVAEVSEVFGMERMLYVLANTVQHSLWDARYCPPIKDWAQTVRIYEEPHPKFGDRTCHYCVNAHPGLIDLFIQQALKTVNLRKEAEEGNA